MSKKASELSAIATLTSSDVIIVGDQSAGYDLAKMTPSVLTTYLNSNLSFPNSKKTTQYSAPSATGFSVSITDGSADIHLILTPVAGYAAGTIVLPTSTNLVDKQEITVNCTQVVTTLTINKNGATAVTGAPTTLAANDYFTLKYDSATSTWYRVG